MIVKKFRKKHGLNLIELMVILVLGSLGIFAVSSIVIESYKEWKRSNEVARLQQDLDLASYTIKGVLEEAENVGIVSEDHIIAQNLSAGWMQEFYQDASNLMWKNTETNETQKVISTLKDINFEIDQENGSIVNITIDVEKGERTIYNSFSVFMRNS